MKRKSIIIAVKEARGEFRKEVTQMNEELHYEFERDIVWNLGFQTISLKEKIGEIVINIIAILLLAYVALATYTGILMVINNFFPGFLHLEQALYIVKAIWVALNPVLYTF